MSSMVCWQTAILTRIVRNSFFMVQRKWFQTYEALARQGFSCLLVCGKWSRGEVNHEKEVVFSSRNILVNYKRLFFSAPNNILVNPKISFYKSSGEWFSLNTARQPKSSNFERFGMIITGNVRTAKAWALRAFSCSRAAAQHICFFLFW